MSNAPDKVNPVPANLYQQMPGPGPAPTNDQIKTGGWDPAIGVFHCEINAQIDQAFAYVELNFTSRVPGERVGSRYFGLNFTCPVEQ